MATLVLLPVSTVHTVEKAQDKTVPGAGFILFRQKDIVEIALVKGKNKDGKWGFPKGCSEEKDDGNLIFTAYRELFEEAGIKAELFDAFTGSPLIETKQKTCKQNGNIYDKINYYFTGIMKLKFNDTKYLYP